MEALKREFGENLIVYFDRAPYCYAKDLWEYVRGEREMDTGSDTGVACAEGEEMKIWCLPPHLPELNPVKNCLTQFKKWYKYRIIETLDELKTTRSTAFRSISKPDILEYICSQ